MNLPDTRAEAAALEARDSLAAYRGRFRIPCNADGTEKIYLCGNSLGLQSEDAAQAVETELASWARLGVDGHFDGPHPWMPYHRELTADLAAIVGALPDEVVAMNSLTVNLHLMLVSFYRPEGKRRRILIERGAFPSDRYAMASQLRFHGLDPDHDLVELEDAPGSATLSTATLERYLERSGDTVALILVPGVQYRSGQFQDISAICELGRRFGASVGLDLAHAVGNVPLALHDWGPDFAVWCSYKYLNAGPGAVAGCFVHGRHGKRDDLQRFAGWWGHDQATRFRMAPEFHPTPGADGWQLSNPPILALAPLRASLAMFADAGGMAPLRQRSLRLTGLFERCIKRRLSRAVEIVTPGPALERGCQLSLRLTSGATAGRAAFKALEERGAVCDWREPDIIRIAPVPLYNTLTEAFDFAAALEDAIHAAG